MKRLLLLSLLVIAAFGSKAQQDPQYSFYMFNQLYINPAYAGSAGYMSMSAIHRQQWVSLPGAPRSGTFAIHSPLKHERMALGGQFTTDRLGATNMNTAYLSYAYRFPVGNSGDAQLSFGLNAGGSHYSADLTDAAVNDPGDPLFASNPSVWMFNAGLGAYLHSDDYYIGLSVPHLFNNSLTEDFKLEGDNETSRLSRTIMLHGGYVFDVNESVKFKPSFLVKYVEGAPMDFDLTAAFMFVDRLWLGVSHRTGDAYIFMAEFWMTEQLRLGYAYDHTITQLNQYSNGTHEIMIGYDLSFSKGNVVHPRYF